MEMIPDNETEDIQTETGRTRFDLTDSAIFYENFQSKTDKHNDNLIVDEIDDTYMDNNFWKAKTSNHDFEELCKELGA